MVVYSQVCKEYNDVLRFIDQVDDKYKPLTGIKYTIEIIVYRYEDKEGEEVIEYQVVVNIYANRLQED